MAMDQTDKKLFNGAILVVISGLIAYYLPTYGYQEQQKREEDKRNELRQVALGGKEATGGYEFYYSPLQPVIYGGLQSGTTQAPIQGTPIAISKSNYSRSNSETEVKIAEKEAASKMAFPEWTNIPPDTKEPGIYFASQFEQKRALLQTMWRLAGVENVDEDIGFSKEKYNGFVLDENKTKEFLRELFIAEKMITLCVEAKQREEELEKRSGLQSEAFMRILSVSPQESVATGPSALMRNTNYNPDEHNPTSDRFRKYRVRQWRNFIQEYPVEIVFQCDVNTFHRFLHSVGTPGQFLVIRTMEILSPFMDESKNDKSEYTRMFKSDIEDMAGKKVMVKDEHIVVRMSAAGMDFFDPDKTQSLYTAKQGPVKVAPPRTRRAIQ